MFSVDQVAVNGCKRWANLSMDKSQKRMKIELNLRMNVRRAVSLPLELQGSKGFALVRGYSSFWGAPVHQHAILKLELCPMDAASGCGERVKR